MKECEYSLEIMENPMNMKKQYFIRLYFNRYYCLQIEISEQNYKDILEEEQK